MSALRRLLAAPLLWVALCALQLGLARALAVPIAILVRATLGARLWPYPDRLPVALVDLFTDEPSLALAISVAATASAVLGVLLGLLLGGGALGRLAGRRGAPEFARACLAHLPALSLIAVYGLVLRLLLAFAAHAIAGGKVAIELALLVLLLTYSTCVVDLASARRVVRGDRGVHPREFIRACASAARSPRLWLASGALSVVRWALLAAIVLVAVHGLGSGWSIWGARGLACLACFAGLWRLAVAVEQVEREPRA